MYQALCLISWYLQGIELTQINLPNKTTTYAAHYETIFDLRSISETGITCMSFLPHWPQFAILMAKNLGIRL